METTTQTHTPYISADAIPELYLHRNDVRGAAESLMSVRHRQIEANTNEGLPLAIDALSTADRVHEAQVVYGWKSPEYLDRYEGLVMDCRRLVAEWRRKNKPEVFAAIVHDQDEQTDEFIANGMSVWQMTEDALVPTAEPEEDARRVNERVEEATAMKMRSLGGLALGSTVRMRTVSECTDWSIRSYKEDGKSRGGYVPEIEKLMARDMVIDVESGRRIEEQVGLPGLYFTHEIIQRALQRREFNADDLDKTSLHGTQILAQDTLLEFVALLDEVASEEWCVEIFMGEVVPEGTIKDYQAFYQEAMQRQSELESDAHMVADFVMELRDQEIDRQQAPDLVEDFVKNLLINLSQEKPELATEIFDEKTAIGLFEVQQLQQLGEFERAEQLLGEVIEQAPGGGYCGAGSCDLVRASRTGQEAEKLEELGFDPESTLLDKGDRKCKKCSERTVAYELSKKEKGCMSCGAKTKY